MILLHDEIIKEINDGHISIEPFEPSQVNPNSYDLRLGENVIYYSTYLTENNKVNNLRLTYKIGDKIKIGNKIIIPEGYSILAETLETTWTDKFVPMIEGKSTIARQFLMVHVTAGFGDIGFKGKWTLELYALRDIELTIGQRICQIYWHEAKGTGPMYNGKYQNAQGVEGAKI